jgi:hypothetical protein
MRLAPYITIQLKIRHPLQSSSKSNFISRTTSVWNRTYLYLVKSFLYSTEKLGTVGGQAPPMFQKWTYLYLHKRDQHSKSLHSNQVSSYCPALQGRVFASEAELAHALDDLTTTSENLFQIKIHVLINFTLSTAPRKQARLIRASSGPGQISRALQTPEKLRKPLLCQAYSPLPA